MVNETPNFWRPLLSRLINGTQPENPPQSHPHRPGQKIRENIDYAAQGLIGAPADQRREMLENIAKALTRRLLKDSPGIGAREVSGRVTSPSKNKCSSSVWRHAQPILVKGVRHKNGAVGSC